MIEVREVSENGIHFMKCHIEKLDEFLNLVISKEISADDAILFVWIASFAWKAPRKKRNACKLSISKMADYFEISEQSVRRRLKRLRDAELIESEYRIKGRDGFTTSFKKSASTWEAKKKSGGRIEHAYHHVLDETFIVRTGKKEGQVYQDNNEVLH